MGGTLDDVRKRGFLRCGVSEGLVGFSKRGTVRGWSGFDVDFCRAVAAAVLNDVRKVKFVPLSASRRFGALEQNKIDILSRNTTWTMSREVLFGVDFVGVWFFDFQALLARASESIKQPGDLAGKVICGLKGTTQEQNLVRFLRENNVKAELLLSPSRAGARSSYERGLCAIYASDASALAGERSLLPRPSEHAFLPFVLSKEPLGPVVRNSDPVWRELVQWVLFLLINAEEVGWTAAQASKANLPARLQIPSKVTARLGLQRGWARRVIAKLGHYGEIYDRNLGPGTVSNLQRGLNALWKNGGLMFAPPIR
jgi:general L-amino acid transport system substrate-binding protein